MCAQNCIGIFKLFGLGKGICYPQYERIKYPCVTIPAMFGFTGYHYPETLSSAALNGGRNVRFPLPHRLR